MKSISLEVYDECALTMDELIAYGQIPIPEIVFRGESADQWLQLSGKQGEHKEGSIHMIFTLLVKIWNRFYLPFSCCDAWIVFSYSRLLLRSWLHRGLWDSPWLQRTAVIHLWIQQSFQLGKHQWWSCPAMLLPVFKCPFITQPIQLPEWWLLKEILLSLPTRNHLLRR